MSFVILDCEDGAGEVRKSLINLNVMTAAFEVKDGTYIHLNKFVGKTKLSIQEILDNSFDLVPEA